MTFSDIYICFVPWGNGGKNRPVLVLENSGATVEVLPITSQYENKSPYIKAKYFEITDWEQAGLSKLCYIDTGTSHFYSYQEMQYSRFVGKLTNKDKLRLILFLKNNYNRDIS
jgi:hypothetical protein